MKPFKVLQDTQVIDIQELLGLLAKWGGDSLSEEFSVKIHEYLLILGERPPVELLSKSDRICVTRMITEGNLANLIIGDARVNEWNTFLSRVRQRRRRRHRKSQKIESVQVTQQTKKRLEGIRAAFKFSSMEQVFQYLIIADIKTHENFIKILAAIVNGYVEERDRMAVLHALDTDLNKYRLSLAEKVISFKEGDALEKIRFKNRIDLFKVFGIDLVSLKRSDTPIETPGSDDDVGGEFSDDFDDFDEDLVSIASDDTSIYDDLG